MAFLVLIKLTNFSYHVFLISIFLVFLIDLSVWSINVSFIQYPLLFLPRYWVFFLLIPVLIFNTPLLKKKIGMTIFASIFLVLFFMDFQLPSLNKSEEAKNEYSISVMSANLGGEINTASWVKKQLLSEKIDIAGFQETSKELGEKLTPKGWYSHCMKGLCVVSKFEIRYLAEESESIAARNGYSQYACLYEVDINGRMETFLNIHLETPRKAYSEFHLKDMSLSPFYDNAIQRYVEAKLVRTLMDKYKPSIVLGDFNMPGDSVIYKEIFSDYKNSFQVRGFGFGYTKYTSLHGIRIDHILTTNLFEPISAKIGLDVGSDHRPIIAKIVIKPKITGAD